MTEPHLNTGTVRLIDRRTRVVEALGPEPPGSRRRTDRELLAYRPQASFAEFMAGPQRIGHCFQADGRRAKFLVAEGQRGDQLLDLLARHPKTPARPVRPYGIKGWLVES